MNYVRTSLVLALLLSFAPALVAERIYTFSLNTNLIASGDDNPRLNNQRFFRPLSGNLALVYGVHPTLVMRSIGARSEFEVGYSFGLDRIESNLDLTSESHGLNATGRFDLGRNWKIRFSESLRRSPDFATFSLFNGVVFTPEGIFFSYDTLVLRENSYANTASLNVDYTLNPASSLTFTLGHSLRNYPDDLNFRRALSDQNRYLLSVRYHRAQGQRTNWNASYGVSQFEFRDFDAARSHNLGVGVSREITPSLSINLDGGPSYTESLGPRNSFLGYHGSFRLTKEIEDNHLSLSYNHRSGTSTGIGSVSSTDRVALNFSRPLGRQTRLDMGLSVHDSKRRLDNPIDIRGLNAQLNLRFLLTDNWSLAVGGSYNHQERSELFDVERRRIILSLRYVIPEFWRFQR